MGNAVHTVLSAGRSGSAADANRPRMITIDDTRRERITTQLRAFFQKELEEELSAFRAEQILDFFLATLGPQVYNQAVQDARRFMQERLEDLDGEVYQPEGT